jgi:O-antigen/teichoic acid export membrane protein
MIRFYVEILRGKLRLHKVALHSVAMLWIGSLCGAFLAFVTQVLLARILGVNHFGEFSSALATVMLVAPLAGFGISGYWLNVFGREGWGARRWMSASLWFLAISTCMTMIAVLLWAWAGLHDSVSSWLLTVLVVLVLGQSVLELAGVKYQLEEKYIRLAIWQLLPHLLRFLCVITLVVYYGKDYLSTQHVAMAYSAAAVIILIAGGYQIVLMARGGVALKGHGAEMTGSASRGLKQPTASDVALAAWPFGLAGFFYLIYFQSSIVLISYLVNEAAVGLYNAAFIVMTAVYLFPSVLYQKFLLPNLHRLAHHDIAGLYRVYRTGNLWMMIFGLSIMVMVWLISPIIFPLLFGPEYKDAVPLLMILAFAIPFRFLASSAGAMLVTRDNIQIKVRLMGAGAVVNVVLNLVLIPHYGPVGAAVATVLTEACTMALYFLYIRKLNLFGRAGG